MHKLWALWLLALIVCYGGAEGRKPKEKNNNGSGKILRVVRPERQISETTSSKQEQSAAQTLKKKGYKPVDDHDSSYPFLSNRKENKRPNKKPWESDSPASDSSSTQKLDNRRYGSSNSYYKPFRPFDSQSYSHHRPQRPYGSSDNSHRPHRSSHSSHGPYRPHRSSHSSHGSYRPHRSSHSSHGPYRPHRSSHSSHGPYRPQKHSDSRPYKPHRSSESRPYRPSHNDHRSHSSYDSDYRPHRPHKSSYSRPHRPSGYKPSRPKPSGHRPSGNRPFGNKPFGHRPPGNRPGSGNRPQDSDNEKNSLISSLRDKIGYMLQLKQMLFGDMFNFVAGDKNKKKKKKGSNKLITSH